MGLPRCGLRTSENELKPRKIYHAFIYVAGFEDDANSIHLEDGIRATCIVLSEIV